MSNEEIRELRSAGYTDEEIAEMIAEGDPDVAAGVIEELIDEVDREEFEDEAQKRGVIDYD